VSGPDFDELVGTDLSPAERERLRRVHDLLVAAGPPAELTPALASPRVRALPRRRLLAIALAAALAVAAFGAGWLFGGGGDDLDVRAAVPMHATAKAPGASALIELGYPDDSGNWEMVVTAHGLEQLPQHGYYVLMLTLHGKPVATCGSFKVDERGEAKVRLGASYRLRDFDGWVVRPYVHGRDKLNKTILLRT